MKGVDNGTSDIFTALLFLEEKRARNRRMLRSQQKLVDVQIWEKKKKDEGSLAQLGSKMAGCG